MQSFNFKRTIAFVLSVVLVCGVFVLYANNYSQEGSSEVFAADNSNVIILQVDNPVMIVNGVEKDVDEGNNTKPIIIDGRTMLPVRAVIESVGGQISWDSDSRTTTLSYNNKEIILIIDSKTAIVDGEMKEIDTVPVIVNGRTMLPIRFIAENFGFEVEWNEAEKTVKIIAERLYEEMESTEITTEIATENLSEETTEVEGDASVVYMTKDISPESLMKIYNALDYKLKGKVGVKISTGEAGGHNYLAPELIKDLVNEVNGTIVECNTAYGGSRAETAVHMQTAKDHGFTEIADVDILDADGSMTLNVEGGKNLTENYVGKNFANYDSFLVLSHFKGHAMGGFGGALKNISIGFGSSEGKAHIHTAGKGGSIFGADQNAFLESMAEAAKSVDQKMGDEILYINVMNRLSVDCDCDSNPAEPTMADIGILASKDPVALDKACVDLVYAAPDGKDLIERMESRNGAYILDHAEKIGVGTKNYKIVSID